MEKKHCFIFFVVVTDDVVTKLEDVRKSDLLAGAVTVEREKIV
jgi:hypothetical protein